MKSSLGKGANWLATRLSSPFCLSVALLVIAVPSHAQVLTCSSIPLDKQTFCSKSKAGASTYCAAYAHIVANIPSPFSPGCFWRQVTQLIDPANPKNPVRVPTGLGIWNPSGTGGAGIISEVTSYAMILAALYDDKATFDKLSATVQAGISYNTSKGNPPLFPWFWKPVDPNNNTTQYSPADLNSASDADINIALAYVYADMAVTVYGWGNVSNPTLNYVNASYPPAPSTYHEMASNYIKAIRCGDPDPMACAKQEVIGDFSKTDTDANNHVLADGYTQATGGFSGNNWHPDYSDIRAYQLFKTYDAAGKAFWDTAISTTKVSWKAIFNFGSSDTRTKENANTGPIDPANSWVKLSNPTYQNLQATFANPQSSPPDYTKVKANRGGTDPQSYTADSQRLPIRLLNYLNATKNSTDPDYMSMLGIASANLTALGTSYTGTNDQALADRVSIVNPYPSNGPYIQNRTAAGLLAYASNNTLSYGDREAVRMDLLGKFGNGNNGKPAPQGGATINMDLDNSFDDPKNHFGVDGFNALLSLWALTVSINGQTPLQKHILMQ